MVQTQSVISHLVLWIFHWPFCIFLNYLLLGYEKYSKTNDLHGQSHQLFLLVWNEIPLVRSNVEWNIRWNNLISPLMASLEEIEKCWESKSISWKYLLLLGIKHCLLHIEAEGLGGKGSNVIHLSPGNWLFIPGMSNWRKRLNGIYAIHICCEHYIRFNVSMLLNPFDWSVHKYFLQTSLLVSLLFCIFYVLDHLAKHSGTAYKSVYIHTSNTVPSR